MEGEREPCASHNQSLSIRIILVGRWLSIFKSIQLVTRSCVCVCVCVCVARLGAVPGVRWCTQMVLVMSPLWGRGLMRGGPHSPSLMSLL